MNRELAEKLRSAGLEWEPKLGDWYFYPNDDFTGLFFYNECFGTVSRRCWLPRIDQLLAEIEARGHAWELRTIVDESEPGNPRVVGYWIHVWRLGKQQYLSGVKFFADSKEDVAAHVLLRIMEVPNE